MSIRPASGLGYIERYSAENKRYECICGYRRSGNKCRICGGTDLNLGLVDIENRIASKGLPENIYIWRTSRILRNNGFRAF